MTSTERANECYKGIWVDNGTHSEEYVIAKIAEAIRLAELDAEKYYKDLYNEVAAKLNSANYVILQIRDLINDMGRAR